MFDPITIERPPTIGDAIEQYIAIYDDIAAHALSHAFCDPAHEREHLNRLWAANAARQALESLRESISHLAPPP